eukprot:scaffold32536_cov58-Phaeocystis_antarctica.AAC.1
MLSVDGRCKTWDARANGYVRSEGVGCTVLAAGGEGAAGVGLLGLAVRQDGRSASLTAPNGSTQRTLLGAALVVAGVAATGVARLEAHGTGTALGDPTEAGSLAAALCGRASGRSLPLAMSAAKASIGHSEAASGQAGVQRLTTALGRLSAGGNAQLRRLNPFVGELWRGAAAALGTQQVQVGGCGAGPVSGVSSFGYSGTIAHAVLQCAPGGTALAVGGGAALRFRRRAFLWTPPVQRTHIPPTAPAMPFLGSISERSATSVVWEQQFSPFELAFLQGHRVGKVMLLPGTCYIEMARAAVRQQHGS